MPQSIMVDCQQSTMIDKEGNSMDRANFKIPMSIVGGVAFCLAAASAGAQCLSAPPGLVEAGYLTVGTSLTAPPMGFMKEDKPSGFDPEFITAVAEKMCLKTKFVNVTFQGLFPGLIAKKFDVIASQIGITDPRKEMFDFVPVFVGGLRLVTQKDSGLRFKTESDVCGYAASIVAGSTQMAALERVKGECPAGKPMTLKVFSNQSEALNEVAKGAVNVAYVDWPVAANLIQQRPNDFIEASPVLSGKGPNTERNRNGIVIRKGDSATQEAVSAAVKAAMSAGAYDEILKRWNLADGDVRKVN
jgi:polar amino acid transport system substrate-binding protein